MVGNKKQSLWQRLLRLAEDGNIAVVEDQQTTTPMSIKRFEIGTTGSRNDAGYPSEEYLSELRGYRRADIFDEMRRSDAQIVMCLAAVKNPIKSATWEIEPGAAEGELPTPEAEEDAKLIRHILFDDLDRPWKKVLSEILTFIDFGHSVFEITHKVALDHPRFGSYNGIASLGFRSPRTIDKWNLNKSTGKLASIEQIVEGDLFKANIVIPDQFLLTFSLNQEGSNYEGISMLRPCYGPWLRKDLYLKLNAIGIEKFAVGTPIGEIPAGKENSQELANMITALEKYVSHESGYLLFPSGWKLDLNNNSYDPSRVEDSIDREDRRMAKSFLANFLELGMSGGGAYALSNDLSDFMLSGLEHVADEIAAPINMDLIPSLIKINRGQREFYPRLKHSGISDKAGKELADMLKALGDGKWLTPEDGDEEHLRRRIGLPARTGEGVREVQPQQQQFGQPQTMAERMKLAEMNRLKGSRG